MFTPIVTHFDGERVALRFGSKQETWAFCIQFHPDIAELILEFRRAGFVFQEPILIEKMDVFNSRRYKDVIWRLENTSFPGTESGFAPNFN